MFDSFEYICNMSGQEEPNIIPVRIFKVYLYIFSILNVFACVKGYKTGQNIILAFEHTNRVTGLDCSTTHLIFA